MKKNVKYLLGILTIVIVFVGVIVFIKLNKDFPKGSVQAGYRRCYVDEGMYFVRGNSVWFFDNVSGKETAVCNKPNCKHNDENCNAYFSGLIGEMLVYDGYIYIGSFFNELSHDENNELTMELDSRFTQLSVDGTKRKEIYNTQNGSLTSAIAKDGKVYFTAYEYQNGWKPNEYPLDSSLYSYDLRWNKLDKIFTYKADAQHYNGNLDIIGCDDDNIFFLYTFWSENGEVTSSIQKYKIGTDKPIELRRDSQYLDAYVIEGEKYILYRTYKDENIVMEDPLFLVKCNDDFQDEEKIFVAESAAIHVLDGYIHIINDDYNKVLFDYKNMKYYVATTSLTGEGKYISDIYNTDLDKNMVYIDSTDYTGYLPGDALPGDISNNAALPWDDFLNEFFIPYEDLNEQDKEKMWWIILF